MGLVRNAAAASLALVLFAALVSLVVGCRREPSPPPTLDIADPQSVPSGAEKITCRVGPKQTTGALDDAGLHLRFVTARGNTVSMFGQDLVVGDPADTVLANALAHFADGRAGEPWLDVDARVKSPDGQNVTVKVSLHIDRAMFKLLDRARGAAVVFQGDAPASASKIASVRRDDDGPAYVVGEGRWRDVDLVAFESSKETGGKSCGSVANGWNQSTVMSGQLTSHVELHERRTGKRVDETTIVGPDTCPSETDAAISRSNETAIRAWVGAKLLGRGP